ncbi:hypothetical protein P6P90_10995 [Ectobacillus antri]|jgi:hypothetical protein|uniref:Uncharacterized protein n=1 Tax=Ectobacillus antri TaxID=2486280 RepID=A0ABT6H5I9_9BACI|nr:MULTISPECIES: hypothetical protein [Ectobacillus]MDG4657375.1 hypothetical protein [Ectobacillus antri]MDG5754494.1 hypothetical protein [Ectobacillus antri]UOY91907.1 hypothetical protein MUG87_15750 [Ectobacillus sp. JY-23]
MISLTALLLLQLIFLAVVTLDVNNPPRVQMKTGTTLAMSSVIVNKKH